METVNRAFFDDYLDAWNAHDAAAVARHMADEAIFGQLLSNDVCRLGWDTERRDSVNRRAALPLRVDGKLPTHGL